jgi:outer membrane protein OmpA-like peptidoglycan-associated protein/outer membrane protein W
MNRFAALAIALVCVSVEASAGVEFGGTMGLHIFNEKNAVGEPDTAGDQRVSLSNSALFGLRLGVYFGPMFGVEAEGGMIPGETRDGENNTTPLVAATGITYRAQAVAQFRAADPSNRIIPFVLAGAGMFQIVTTENDDVIVKDSTPIFYAGAGAKYRTKEGWVIRLDARVLFPKKSGGAMEEPSGITQDFEFLVGVGKDFGAKKVEIIKDETPLPVADQDPDKDGIIGAADKCPNEPEDTDSFEDDNGCPDPDNDQDGVLDPQDKCPDQAETKNGFQDEDGCPDEIPVKLKKFTGVIKGINFKVNSADLLPASNNTLNQAVAVLKEFPDLKLEIQGHTDDQPLKGNAKPGSKFMDNQQLSQGRAESVKAYLVNKGIEDARLTAVGFGDSQPVEAPAGLKGGKLNAARAKNRRVEFKLISALTATPPPATTPAPEPTPAPAPNP